MSSPALKDRICLVGIYHAPLHISRDEFRTRIDSLMSASLENPAMKENTLEYNLIMSNTRLDHTNKAAGVRPPHVTAIITADYETHDNLLAVLKHPEFQQWSRHPDFSSGGSASLFGAKRNIFIDKPGIPENRVHGIAILQVPEDKEPGEYAAKAESIVKRAQELACVRKGVLRLTLFSPDGSMNGHLDEAHSSSESRHIFILDAEYENAETHKEVVDDPAFAEIHERMKDYYSPSFFGADPTIKKI